MDTKQIAEMAIIGNFPGFVWRNPGETEAHGFALDHLVECENANGEIVPLLKWDGEWLEWAVLTQPSDWDDMGEYLDACNILRCRARITEEGIEYAKPSFAEEWSVPEELEVQWGEGRMVCPRSKQAMKPRYPHCKPWRIARAQRPMYAHELRTIRQALRPTKAERLARGEKRKGTTAANWDDDRGITQGELAKRLGVALNTVWRWEKGRLEIPKAMGLLMQGLASGAIIV